MSRHHPTLAPSSLDKKNECIGYTSGPGGKASQRGSVIHVDLADILYKKETPSDPLLSRAIGRMRKFISSIEGIETELQLLDDNLEQVTFGTCDVWGTGHDGVLTLVDWKTGVQPADSYQYQMAVYALMLMEQEDAEACRSVIVPVDNDENEAFVMEFTRESAQELILPLLERIKANAEEPKENQFCNWCASRKTCPVWVEPAKEAMQLTPHGQALLFTEDDAKARPEVYLAAFNKLEAILMKDWDIKGIIKARLETGEAVPGWKLQKRKGTTSVTSVEETLHKVVKAIGFTKAADFIKVDAGKMAKAWAAFSTDPLPVTLIEGESTTALVAAKEAA